ncbi:MAG: carboxylase [Firmicutes bacterium ZCTH02-B6]|nr:MAG: carboxylase [Firmicutes bacterium ZCTH02-B6]
MGQTERLWAEVERISAGGPRQYHEKLRQQGKMFVRERLAKLLDPGSFVEDGLLARCEDPGLPADAVVTGIGRINGRTVCIMASDATVKAGTWGARTVEKIVRIQEQALKFNVPLLYLVDSAGGRITDQVEMFPGRRHAGRIFYNQVKMSGRVPQVCVLFGPSPAGAAYLPALSDVVIMVDGNASAYLGSPRMAEMVIGEKVDHETMGGARMHCTVSGLGDFLAASEDEAIELMKRYLSYMPDNWMGVPPAEPPQEPDGTVPLSSVVPPDQNTPFNMYRFIDGLVDGGSFFEIKKEYAPELITGFARLNGRVIGIVANQPAVKGGVLFVDSADKGARFIWLCNAYNIPLLFLADVPGFMIGSRVERQGIIRHGAKMICAVSEATVPKISVIVRKAYGAGLYAMAGPAFEPDACIALPRAQIAIMGPEAAVNAVYYNKIQELPQDERPSFVAAKRAEYAADIDIFRLASELIVDAVVDPDQLRAELIRRFAAAAGKAVTFTERRCPVYPV